MIKFYFTKENQFIAIVKESDSDLTILDSIVLEVENPLKEQLTNPHLYKLNDDKNALIKKYSNAELLQQKKQQAIADINCIFGNCIKAQDNTCIRITRIAEKVIANDNNYKKYLKSLAVEQNLTEKKLAENIIAAYEEETYLIAQIRILTSNYIKDINNAKTTSAIEEVLAAAKTFLQDNNIAELKTYYQANKSKTSIWSGEAEVKKLKNAHKEKKDKEKKLKEEKQKEKESEKKRDDD